MAHQYGAWNIFELVGQHITKELKLVKADSTWYNATIWVMLIKKAYHNLPEDNNMLRKALVENMVRFLGSEGFRPEIVKPSFEASGLFAYEVMEVVKNRKIKIWL